MELSLCLRAVNDTVAIVEAGYMSLHVPKSCMLSYLCLGKEFNLRQLDQIIFFIIFGGIVCHYLTAERWQVPGQMQTRDAVFHDLRFKP